MRDYTLAAIRAEFPGVKLDGGGVTPLQGRVVFHQERIFRSTGGGQRAHARYIELCRAAGLPFCIEVWNRAQCVRGLQLIEMAARDAGLSLFRDCRTDWERI